MPAKPFYDELAAAYLNLHTVATIVSDHFRSSKGGDEFVWTGGIVHYRVRLNKRWVDVPPSAVVTEPNKFGPAVVWPYQDAEGATQIRCFLPGAGA